MRQARQVAILLLGVMLCMSAAWGQTPGVQDQALADARAKLKEQVLGTELEPGLNVGEALRQSGRLGELESQLDAVQPVGGLRWIGDHGCQVRLEWSGGAAAKLLSGATAGTTRPSKPLRRLERTTYVSVGTSISSNGETKGGSQGPCKLIPQQPPVWVNRPIQAEAWVRPVGAPLLTAQAAEKEARQSVRDRLGALPLAYQTTVDQAAKLEPSVGQAVDRAMVQARVVRTDYAPDGSVTVRMELNLRFLWEELNR
jgi:hypothetical protein